jgi:hypothetical protein
MNSYLFAIIRGSSVACILLGLAGCSPEEGLKRYGVSGSVVLADGKPVPAGEISFEPNSSAGNKGPGSIAPIKDGKYALAADQGILGGAYIVTITSYDGVATGESLMGKPLVKQPHVEKVDMPSETSTRDFKVTTK